MRLNLKEYTDPNDVAFHANGYFESWRFIQFLDMKDEAVATTQIEQEAEEHRDWLVENVPWLVPYVDAEIIAFLRPRDLLFQE
jgi:hypothetical protein